MKFRAEPMTQTVAANSGDELCIGRGARALTSLWQEL